jgi:ubiquinone/menaquinone biosynthesis C-methylase UbiE
MSIALNNPAEAAQEIVRYGDETADIHSSSEEYAARFGGPVGNWMLEVQEHAVLRALDDECTSVLDVGGGHGQIALPLARANRDVMVLGSSHTCAERLREYIESGLMAFRAGNLVELPFESRSFNLVVSFRLMSHCTAWRTLITEMCRVSNHAVIVDYPVWMSANILTPLLFKLKKRLEGNTRTYRIFSSRDLIREFRRNGFRLASLEKQFFFPMGLHRALKSPGISRRLEAAARFLRLTRLFGSPVVAKFVREG